MKISADIQFDSEYAVEDRPCIFLQIYGGDMKKKKKCCKNYRKDKRCKKCPDD